MLFAPTASPDLSKERDRTGHVRDAAHSPPCAHAAQSGAGDRALHYARGVKGPKFLVDGADGKPFTVPDAAVHGLCELDREGAFDDPRPGNAARLQGAELLAAIAGEALANLLALLFPAPVPPVSREPTKTELLEAGRPDPGLRTSSWVDISAISASTAPDVLARAENYSLDDRTFEQRSARRVTG